MAKVCPRCSELLPDDAAFCPFDGAALTKSDDRLLGKTIAARYRLTRRLGSGGMSVVYLARHEIIDRLNAIKILRPELSKIPEHRERFLREARAVNRVNHPNIVEITDVGESDGVAYLVMEYVEGTPLLEHVQDRPLGWERASRIAVQVASALARAHQARIIHRDLKPENILLLPRPSPSYEHADGAQAMDLVKLIDFGIAKMADEPALTRAEQLFGTPGYIAPEHIAGLPIDGRADLYSLGVVLYEMVTGVLPFDSRSQADLLLSPLTSAPTPPGDRVGGLPSELEDLLLRCLAREPDRRPRDAFALQDELVEILRRHGRASVLPAERAPSALPPASPREVMETFVDRPSVPHRASADVGQVATKIGARWLASSCEALAELEGLVEETRRRGGAPAADRAAEHARAASEMIPRIERAANVVGELQTKVDALEADGREARASIGHALDMLARDRSRERAHLDALRARREALERPFVEPPGGASAPPRSGGVWELEALGEEERRAERVVADLSFQIDTLQIQLDRKNEEHERALAEATGVLEGSLSALRRLSSEIARTVDDGMGVLRPRAQA